MAFRFWRRLKVAPGVTLNLSKSGGSLSFGPRGGKFTVGPRGKRVTAGLPGTGLFYTKTVGGNRRGQTTNPDRDAERNAPSVGTRDRLSLGFFQRLATPKAEEAFVDGCREMLFGSPATARAHLESATHLADAAFLAGYLAFKERDLHRALAHFNNALEKHQQLGTYFDKYGIAATMTLPVTDDVTAHIGPRPRGVLLAMVEIYQELDHTDHALACLESLRRIEPGDVVVNLSMAEVLAGSRLGDRDACDQIVRLASGIENESPVHAALLMYKGMALRALGLPTAARDALTMALRRTKDRSPELLRAIRYERALAYEEMGQRARARTEFGRIYAEDPGYEDVATRVAD